MTIYQYSGTVTGFFCVIFEIYTKKQPPALITSEREYQYLLDTPIQIVDDHLQHAERVERSIQQKIGKAGFQEILTGLSSVRNMNRTMILPNICLLILKIGTIPCPLSSMIKNAISLACIIPNSLV